jgi:uncharacterized protein
MKNFIRISLILCGLIFVSLGILGIILPILPTTPFFLLAAACFSRSSKRFYTWLITNRWFGAYIRNYREGRGIPVKQKVLVLILLWLTILFSIMMSVALAGLKLLLLIIAAGVTIHILSIKTYRDNSSNSDAIKKPRVYITTEED